MPRLTLAADKERLLDAADEILRCREVEAAAQQDFKEAEDDCRKADVRRAQALRLYQDAIDEVRQARAAETRILDEITTPTDFSEVTDG